MTTPAPDPQKTRPRFLLLLLHLLLHKPSDSTQGAPRDQGTPWSESALGGIRTPSLLIRSKIRLVQIRPSLSVWPASTFQGDVPVPAPSALVQIRC